MLAGLGGKAVERSALIGEIDEYPVQVRQAQYFRGAWVEIYGSQFRAVSPRGIKTPNKLAYSRAVQVGNVPEVQQYLGASFPEDIDQQLMNGFTFYICEVPAHIYDRDVSQLTRIRTEVQTGLRRHGLHILPHDCQESEMPSGCGRGLYRPKREVREGG
jgi:hypothetical protein